ncbi:RNA polymerase sigma factor [Streptomyces sp. ISL-100]|uniref:RNA polymerase sigma factor n=1 Tax=Streptomyces sp. ISL-100 TaxID=2819173 RepID=UPI001BE84C28|nr:RNA polymerase sigma factor [Streptomyces sp. ISL-100]MBT2400260.1 RNA polymerase sigma factor [Streptomyces sp. ISL-100]
MRPSGGDRNADADADNHAADDAALLRAVAKGDSEALAALYDRHAGWLHARLTRRCADPETVREVLQDTFVTAWRSAGSHRGGEAGGWLWVIAARRLVDAQRARTRAERSDRAERAEFVPSGAAPSAEERVLAGLEYGDVGTALDRISPELRDVLRATVIDGLTTRETARLLGLAEGTVKTRAMRARRELREALAELTSLSAMTSATAVTAVADAVSRNKPLGGTA